ncbi:hypothetical protein CYMTET_21514 [Cymbomonas tetramitiformis]|uniref:Uncharacterized protein n=1 Tax=Cymbomonas tetramitiformis TaxID=36881 RepID=A0AAE0G1Z8_9CHLO|nr:hypothetical protein CYMTET_21514 [Cymbomonas tetramitiformis]
MCAVFQPEAADDGVEAFARAATAYGPPAVLCGGVVGGIDVSAYGFSVDAAPTVTATAGGDILQRLDDFAAEVNAAVEPQVHYTHASFPAPGGIEPQTSALVCGPAAAGITPEEQVPAGGAAASASAVPAPAMPVSQGKDVKPVPLQSARVTATAATDGEFAGFVQTANHAAIGQVDLTGYDTDDYEDLADGSFIVKPRTPAISGNHASESATHAPRSGGAYASWPGGASRTYGCGKPPWGFPAHADCRGGLCVYPGIEELSPDTLDAVLASLGGFDPSAVPTDRHLREWWKQGVPGYVFQYGPGPLLPSEPLGGAPPSPDYSPPPSDIDEDESAID